MKTLEELKAGTTITPGEVWEIASANMEPEHIDHHETDLYLRINDVSRVIIGAMNNTALLSTFTSWIDGTRWYELPFCYIPGWTRDPWDA